MQAGPACPSWQCFTATRQLLCAAGRELQEATAGKVKVKRRRPDELSRGGGKGFG